MRPLLAGAVLLAATVAGATPIGDLSRLSLEELMEIEVTTVARKQQTLLEAPAAVAVLTGDDLRRSGARSLPDALRLVPGVQVGRIDAGKWSVSTRGFAGQFANKLLVLVDGRSVYSPLFGGVFWDVQDLLLEDVERIEIIRGPGATQWGANAVNGVINVITRHAEDTQGTVVHAGAGRHRLAEAAVAHGGRIDAATPYRLWTKVIDVPAGTDTTDAHGRDDRRLWRLGARLDHDAGDDALLLQAAVYGGEAGQNLSTYVLEPPYRARAASRTDLGGGHLLARWTRGGGDAETVLQAYGDRSLRRDRLDIDELRHTGDLDLQQRRRVADRHEIVWGLGYRVTHDDLRPTLLVQTRDRSRTDHLVSAFVHDEIDVVARRLALNLGVKWEHNRYTGLEVQPDARLLWTPSDRQSLWILGSRAVRTPARGEDGQSVTVEVLAPGAFLPGPLPTRIAIENDEILHPDELLAVEIGWRGVLTDAYLEAVGYLHHYDRVRSYSFGRPYTLPDAEPPHNVVPVPLTNAMEGRAAGVELSFDWHVTQRWRWRGSYAFLDMEITDPNPLLARHAEGGDARHQLTQWTSLDLTRRWQLDAILRCMGEIPHFDVDAYAELDLRLGWQAADGLELAVGGRNLLDPGRHEYGSGFANLLPTRTERSLYVDAVWRP